jgi:hypothetical protein
MTDQPKLDPKAQEIANRLQALVGQRLMAVKVVPLGVMFEFEHSVYWAYGGPLWKTPEHTR